AFVTEKDGAPTAISTTGDTLFTLKNAEHVREFQGGFAAFSTTIRDGEERWGFIDKKGKTVIIPRFASVSGFSEDMAAVLNDKQEWGYIDDSGTLVIAHQFEYASDFTEGLAVAGTGDKKGVIDRTGKFRINPMFSEAQSDGDLFLVEQNGKWGWIGPDGAFVINPQFSEAMRFAGQALAAVRTGKSWGYIGTDGLYKINPQFNAALPFTGSVALVLMDRQSGLIGKDGKFTANPQFGKPSREFVYALIKDPRAVSSIQTDFFNLPAINAAIDPAALTRQSFSTLAADRGLDPAGFTFSGRHTLISERKISKDCSLTLYALGNPFRKERVQKNFGGYSYLDEEMVADLSIPVSGYEVRIGLSGKGYGRNKSVMDAMRNEFPNAFVIESNDRQIIMRSRDGQQTIRISSGYYAVTMRLTFGPDDAYVDGAD
ncbi:MAG: WG repeat-containing protein, partial [Bacteroidota bacterium]